MEKLSRWRPDPAAGRAVRVAPPAATPPAVGLAVGRTAFASPTAGWACLGGLTDHQLLYTDDAGDTWRPRLSWRGRLTGAVTAFDTGRAALVVGLRPPYTEVNGHPVEADGPTAVSAGTDDAGATWTLSSPLGPHGFTGMFHFLTPHRLWLPAHPRAHGGPWRLARTDDGGASWATAEAPGELPVMQVAFTTAEDGVLVAIDRRRADVLWVTGDGGGTWSRTPLPAPPGVPAHATTWLTPVLRPGRSALLLLRAERHNQAPAPWAGTFAYHGVGRSWSGPYRLPVAPTGLDIAVVGPDGRFWAASGHDLWDADDLAGPWRHRTVPLRGEHLRGASWDPTLVPVPTTEVIADIAPAGDGVVWLTSTHGSALGGVPDGRLLRSGDGGASWTELTVGSNR